MDPIDVIHLLGIGELGPKEPGLNLLRNSKGKTANTNRQKA
jgi:hypothetical protein